MLVIVVKILHIDYIIISNMFVCLVYDVAQYFELAMIHASIYNIVCTYLLTCHAKSMCVISVCICVYIMWTCMHV